MKSKILVLGGTGKTGRKIAVKLKADGHEVRIGSRSGNPEFNWADPEGWEQVLEGIDKNSCALDDIEFISVNPDHIRFL